MTADDLSSTPNALNSQFTLRDPLADPSWDTGLREYDTASVFHSSGWLRALRESYGFRTHAVGIDRGDGGRCTVLLSEVRSRLTGNRLVGLPFTDFCDPLVRGAAQLAESDIDAIKAGFARNGFRYLELRGGSACPDAITQRFFLHTMDLSKGIDALWADLAGRVRRNIRKAQNARIRVRILRTETALRSFYRLHCRTRRGHGIPPQPFRFFALLKRCLLDPGNGFVAEALLGDKVVASNIYLMFGSEAVYKYGASDRRFLSHRPNDFLMWEAVRELSESGFANLSLGRTSPLNEGLLMFKRGWGCEEKSVDYHRYPIAGGAPAFPHSPSGTNLVALLPVFALRPVSRVLYRHFG